MLGLIEKWRGNFGGLGEGDWRWYLMLQLPKTAKKPLQDALTTGRPGCLPGSPLPPAVHVVHPSREADQLRSLLLQLIRQAVQPLLQANVSCLGAAGRCWAAATMDYRTWHLLCMRRHLSPLCNQPNILLPPPPPPTQVFKGNPNPDSVSHFALLQCRQAAASQRGSGPNPHFNAFSQVRSCAPAASVKGRLRAAQPAAARLLG